MTVNTSLLLSNPDFPSILASLKSHMKSQDRFRDYDFDGSNLAVFLEILAYNTYQDSFIAAMAATEMFNDTAQLRSSVVSRAKELGYTPRSVKSATAYINLQITANDNPSSIIIPKGQAFNSLIGSKSYTFSTDDAVVVTPDDAGRYIASNLAIHEGFRTIERYSVDYSIENQIFTISNPKVDTNSIEVFVNDEKYTKATTILDLTSSTKVYFLQLGSTGYYQIYFGDNVIGARPAHLSTVDITYRISSGADANGARSFSINSAIAGYSNTSITVVAPAQGGSDAESTESIRRNAPYNYITRNRAITVNDYKILLQQQFPEIVAINVYGGEQVDPPQFGRVYISVDTNGAVGVSATAAAEYYRYIKDKSPLTIEPVFIDPQTLLVNIDSKVYYDYTNYNATQAAIESAVISVINQYNTDNLNTFNTTFKYSQLIGLIDDAHEAITSNDTEVSMTLFANSEILSSSSQKLQFNNKLRTDLRSISSSLLTYNGLTCSIQDNQNGVLQLITNTQNTTPAVVTNVGTVNYDTGEIILNPISFDRIYGNGLRINAVAESSDINAVKNVILTIDSSNIAVRAIPRK